jgi:hypothetical protein
VSDALSRIVPLDSLRWSLRPASGDTIRRMADLDVRTLAPMHGSTFAGVCRAALQQLAAAVDARISR